MAQKPFHVILGGQRVTVLRYDKQEPQAMKARKARRKRYENKSD